MNALISYILNNKFYRIGETIESSIFYCSPIYTDISPEFNRRLFNNQLAIITNGTTYIVRNYLNKSDKQYYDIQFDKDRKITESKLG